MVLLGKVERIHQRGFGNRGVEANDVELNKMTICLVIYCFEPVDDRVGVSPLVNIERAS